MLYIKPPKWFASPVLNLSGRVLVHPTRLASLGVFRSFAQVCELRCGHADEFGRFVRPAKFPLDQTQILASDFINVPHLRAQAACAVSCGAGGRIPALHSHAACGLSS